MATKKLAKASASEQPTAEQSKRKSAFKLDLNVKIIKALKLSEMPVGHDEKTGEIVWGPNPPIGADGEAGALVPSYIIWDSNSAAPPGFGIRIAAKKTYIIRRKVLGRSIMPNVGNFTDFHEIDSARKKAAVLALKMVETGKNPNEEARRIAASEFTLGMAFERYREHLKMRTQKPAKPETLKVIDRVVRKFGSWNWLERKIKDFKSDEIVKKFEANNELTTANEQRFRWAIAAVNWNIDREKFDAHAANRQALLTFNPFEILVLDKKFRDQLQLDNEREEKSKRNPLGPTTTLGPFLEACWSKKNTNDNETGTIKVCPSNRSSADLMPRKFEMVSRTTFMSSPLLVLLDGLLTCAPFLDNGSSIVLRVATGA